MRLWDAVAVRISWCLAKDVGFSGLRRFPENPWSLANWNEHPLAVLGVRLGASIRFGQSGASRSCG